MRNLPRPGIEPVSLALTGKLLTTGPRGNSCIFLLKTTLLNNSYGLFQLWHYINPIKHIQTTFSILAKSQTRRHPWYSFLFDHARNISVSGFCTCCSRMFSPSLCDGNSDVQPNVQVFHSEKSSLTSLSETETLLLSTPSPCFVILSPHLDIPTYLPIYYLSIHCQISTIKTEPSSVFSTVFLILRTFPGT